MRHPSKAVFPTFVLVMISSLVMSVAFESMAAKETPIPNLEDPPPSEENVEVDPAKRDAVVISPAPPERPDANRPSFFYRYRNGLSPMFGIAYDTRASNDEPGILTVMAIRYLFASESLSSFEAGAELLSNGSGAFQIQKRIDYSRTKFRPYTSLGGGIRIVPKDEVATLLRYEHLQLRGSAGLEYFTTDPISARIDVTGIVTTKSPQAQLTLGATWAW